MMLSPNNKDTFLSLVRLGIRHANGAMPKYVEWDAIETIASKQGLMAVVLDGIDCLPATSRPPQVLLLEWIGEVLQNYEQRYEQYKKAIAELADFYKSHGFKMMVLKGYACSHDWPRPEHRPCGDIDIWQFGQYKNADKAIAKEKGIVIDHSHHHHTVFYWKDFMVENHYDFDNVYTRSSNKELEPFFKHLGEDDSHFVELYGKKVYFPSPNLHALFLIRHMVTHFTSTELSIRQLLDWGFFVKTHGKEIDWEWLIQIIDKFHMKDFYNCVNAICVEDLGFDVDIFPSVQFAPSIKERILNDTLSPEFDKVEPRGTIARLLFKYKRWKANGWKQRLCYRESRWSTFWSGVVNHIFRPGSMCND